jgi:hypothetical protein
MLAEFYRLRFERETGINWPKLLLVERSDSLTGLIGLWPADRVPQNCESSAGLE